MNGDTRKELKLETMVEEFNNVIDAYGTSWLRQIISTKNIL